MVLFFVKRHRFNISPSVSQILLHIKRNVALVKKIFNETIRIHLNDFVLDKHKIDEFNPLTMFKRIQLTLPGNLRQTMDPKFIFVLFFVEVGSLIFNSLHLIASELHVYNAYNEVPVIYHMSSKVYSCFSTINYCIYEHKQLLLLKILDLVFISIIVISYGCLFIIILRQWETIKIRPHLKITWYAGIQFLVLFTLALHTLLIILLLERDTVNTNQCSKQNRLIRAENIFNYFVLSVLEIAYIAFDLVNRQVTPSDSLKQEFEYETQEADHLRIPTSENGQRIFLESGINKKSIRSFD